MDAILVLVAYALFIIILGCAAWLIRELIDIVVAHNVKKAHQKYQEESMSKWAKFSDKVEGFRSDFN